MSGPGYGPARYIRDKFFDAGVVAAAGAAAWVIHDLALSKAVNAAARWAVHRMTNSVVGGFDRISAPYVNGPFAGWLTPDDHVAALPTKTDRQGRIVPISHSSELQGSNRSVIRRGSLYKHYRSPLSSMSQRRSYRKKPVARKFVKKNRVMYPEYGRYPSQALADVEASDGKLQLAGEYGRWGSIPKSPPSGLKYYDACTGAAAGQPYTGIRGLVLADDLWMNCGNPNLGWGNVATSLWDPLGIPITGSTSYAYTIAPGPGSTRASQEIVVAAIIIQVRFNAPLITLDSNSDLSVLQIAGECQFAMRFIMDTQCNGLQFTYIDVDQPIDDKTSSTYVPNGNAYQTLPNVANETRFETVGRLHHRFPFAADDLINAALVGGPAQIQSVDRTCDYEFVVKDPFLVNYQSVAYGSGTGSVDQRKSLNFNALVATNWDSMISLNTMTLYMPGVSILSRTIFYDA